MNNNIYILHEILDKLDPIKSDNVNIKAIYLKVCDALYEEYKKEEANNESTS